MELNDCGVSELDARELRELEGGSRIRIPVGGGEPTVEPDPAGG